MTGHVISIAVAALIMQQSSCDSRPPSDVAQQSAQERMSQEGNAQVRMPGITKFTEKRIMKKLYELRDQNVVTHTYVPDMQGRLWHVCESLGFGLPYGVQFSSPEKVINPYSGKYYLLPQSEPNGLFMPPTAEGTWVICAANNADGFKPRYVEPRIVVSTEPLNSFGDWDKQ